MGAGRVALAVDRNDDEADEAPDEALEPPKPLDEPADGFVPTEILRHIKKKSVKPCKTP